MGIIEYQASTKQDSEDTLPSLIQVISSNGIKGFDNVEANNNPLVGLSAQVSLLLYPSESSSGDLAQRYADDAAILMT